jgi:hypothetical protein
MSQVRQTSIVGGVEALSLLFLSDQLFFFYALM